MPVIKGCDTESSGTSQGLTGPARPLEEFLTDVGGFIKEIFSSTGSSIWLTSLAGLAPGAPDAAALRCRSQTRRDASASTSLRC
ncbi:hypothetical protein EVAR_83176_1 [Eumeta japonica]|uniref:Uncharacterized protein n=1 Tax=Eumeta variegata TaxID=151549 RepID=A0A4C1Y9J3_EUMVA|nr:hypothetical protein EVAR_83176_1 [Eumeta japonica]